MVLNSVRGFVCSLVVSVAAGIADAAISTGGNQTLFDEEDASLFFRYVLPFNRFVPKNFITSGEKSQEKSLKTSQQPPLAPYVSPVILIGGLTTSKISADLHRNESNHFYCEKHVKNYTLWIDPSSFLPFEADCWIDDAKLKWQFVNKDSEPRKTDAQEFHIVNFGVDAPTKVQQVNFGVDAYLPGWKFPLNSTGPATEGMVGDYFQYVTGNMTEKLGYRTGYETGNFQYDFRRGPNEYAVDGTFDRLKAQVELYFENTNRERYFSCAGIQELLNLDDTNYNQKLNEKSAGINSGGNKYCRRVVLMTLSMGGPVTHQFLHWIEESMGEAKGKLWKKTYLVRWISNSGVFKGTSMITSTTVMPDNADLYNVKAKLWYVNWFHVRDALQSWAGNQMMQPQFMGENETLVSVRANPEYYKNYTQSELVEVFEDSGAPPEIQALVADQERWYFKNLRPPQVDVECLHGSQSPVPRSYRYDHGFRKHPVTASQDDGDAVVNAASLSACNLWPAMDKAHYVREKDFPGTRHGGEMRAIEGVNYIVDILKEIAEKNRDNHAEDEDGVLGEVDETSVYI